MRIYQFMSNLIKTNKALNIIYSITLLEELLRCFRYFNDSTDTKIINWLWLEKCETA